MRKKETPRERYRTWSRAVSTGGLSLRKQVTLPRQTVLPEGPTGDYERFLPPSLHTLAENLERNPGYLRQCFGYMLVTMADAYDSMDHASTADNRGTALQDDCHAVRELARSFDIPRSAEAE